MTLYYEEDTDRIIENHPDFVHFDDDGRLIIDCSQMGRNEKRKALLQAAQKALDASDEYELTSEAEWAWIPEDER